MEWTFAFAHARELAVARERGNARTVRTVRDRPRERASAMSECEREGGDGWASRARASSASTDDDARATTTTTTTTTTTRRRTKEATQWVSRHEVIDALGALGRRARALSRTMATKARPWVRERARACAERAKREWASQFPPDDVYAAEFDRLDEIAAFEREIRGGRGSGEDGESRVEVAEARDALAALEAGDSTASSGVDDDSSADDDDGEDDDECDARSPATVANDSCTPAKSTTSYDENDYAYASDVDSEIDLGSPLAEGEQRVVVVPRALVQERDALPQSNALSFVAPKQRTPRAYWNNARRRDRAAAAPVVRVPPARSPFSPEAPIPARSPARGDRHSHKTPPWYQKRFDRETREWAQSARTLLDWAASATDVLLAANDDSNDVKVIQKTSFEPTFVDCGEESMFVHLPRTTFVECDDARGAVVKAD